MAQRNPAIEFEDIPLDKARRMGRGIRMDAELYRALTERIESLSDTATRLILPEDIRPATMKNRILRVAAELNVAVTIKRVPGGLLFWRSTQDDLMPGKEVVQSLQSAQKPSQTTRPARRRRA
jgi:hypothetical protein